MKRPDYISLFDWYEMTEEEQRRELQPLAQDEAAPIVVVKPKPKPRKPKASKKPAPPQHIAPRTIEDAFVVVNGELMRRRVAIVEVVQKDNERFSRQTEALVPCGDRVRFGDRVLLSKVVAHYLTTGETLTRAPREPKPLRFRTRVRTDAGLVHLGYFATEDERNAAVFAFRLGITPSK